MSDTDEPLSNTPFAPRQTASASRTLKEPDAGPNSGSARPPFQPAAGVGPLGPRPAAAGPAVAHQVGVARAKPAPASGQLATSSPPAGAPAGAKPATSGAHAFAAAASSAPARSGTNASLDAATAGACDAVISAFRKGKLERAAAIAKLSDIILKGGGRPEDVSPYIDAICQHIYHSAIARAAGAAKAAAPGGPQPLASILGTQLSPSVPRRRARSPSPVPSQRSSAADDDVGDQSTSISRKRPAYDPSAAPFRDSPLRALAASVSPHVARTLEVRANYCADLRAAKQDLLRDGLSPPFPENLWEDVLANRAVDFDKILSALLAPVVANRSSQQISNTDVYVTVGAAPPERKVSNRNQWLQCWEAYADAVAYAYPHRAPELRVYQRLVTDLFSSLHESHHTAVINADISMRNRLAIERTWSFADEDKLARVHMRDTHSWGSATLSKVADDAKPARKKPARPEPSGELCNNFNDRSCKYDKCRHLHICRICQRKDHGARDHMDAVRKEAEAGTRARAARAAGGGGDA